MNLDEIKIEESIQHKPEDYEVIVINSIEIYIKLPTVMELSANVSGGTVRLHAELSTVQSQIERLEKLLSSDFANKAPASVVGKEREKLAAFKETAEKLKVQLNR